MSDIVLPSLGENITEADVLKVLVAAGDRVTVDQPILEIETEKATLDVPATSAGVVTKVHVTPGQTIRVGAVLVSVEAAAPAESPSAPAAPSAPEPAPAPPAAAPAAEAPAPQPSPAVPASAAPAPAPAPAPVETPAPATSTPIAAPTHAPGDAPVFASPSVRKFAREVGVDLATIAGSGPGGRIDEDDVKRAARTRAVAPTPAAVSETPSTAAGFEARPLPDFTRWGEVTREPMSRLRRTVARNLAQSWAEIPHVHLYHRADITAMEELRQQFKARAQAAGGNLTISVMMLKVVAAALRAHPKFNASLDVDAQEVVLKQYIHLGVAVDTDRGLVVPKIEDADQKNIIEISVELNEIAERARENRLTLEEMTGSTFTVTNLGSLGTGFFDPIINWPEIAVLGLGRAERTAVWDDATKQWTPRLLMPLSLGFDHRVVDGADGARFMSWIVEAIRNPMLMALEG